MKICNLTDMRCEGVPFSVEIFTTKSQDVQNLLIYLQRSSDFG